MKEGQTVSTVLEYFSSTEQILGENKSVCATIACFLLEKGKFAKILLSVIVYIELQIKAF